MLCNMIFYYMLFVLWFSSHTACMSILGLRPVFFRRDLGPRGECPLWESLLRMLAIISPVSEKNTENSNALVDLELNPVPFVYNFWEKNHSATSRKLLYTEFEAFELLLLRNVLNIKNAGMEGFFSL